MLLNRWIDHVLQSRFMLGYHCCIEYHKIQNLQRDIHTILDRKLLYFCTISIRQ